MLVRKKKERNSAGLLKEVERKRGKGKERERERGERKSVAETGNREQRIKRKNEVMARQERCGEWLEKEKEEKKEGDVLGRWREAQVTV